MHFKLDFEGNKEIGTYIRLTNKYIIVGRSDCQNVINFMKETFDCPIVETTINSIKTVGSLCVGNSNGLLLPDTCTDQELQHIRNSLPQNIRVRRIQEKLNCLGNLIACNDYAALIHPHIEEENVKIIEEVLGVPVYKATIGTESLVGTFSVLTNQGMLTGPNVTEVQLKELGELMNVQTIAGTVNGGSPAVGSGIIANDWVCIVGNKCTNVEIKIAEVIFNLSESKLSEKIVIDEIVN